MQRDDQGVLAGLAIGIQLVDKKLFAELVESIHQMDTLLLETTKCRTNASEVQILLNILGRPDALVSDNTKLGDFDNHETVQTLINGAQPGDYLWELGQRINRSNGDTSE